MGFIRLFILFLIVYSALRSFRAFLGSVQAPPRRPSVGDAEFESARQRAQRMWEQAQQQYQYQQQFYQQQQRQQAHQGAQASAAPRQKTPHEVLGVSPGASPREIKLAYQALVRQYHPDRVADLGVELRELAEARTKEINAAYNQLKRS